MRADAFAIELMAASNEKCAGVTGVLPPERRVFSPGNLCDHEGTPAHAGLTGWSP